MKVLFLGSFKSRQFYARYGDPSDPALGGQRKMEFVIRALLVKGHNVLVISSAIAPTAGKGMQRIPDHEETFPEGVVRVVHAPIPRAKPWGGIVMSASGPRTALAVARQFNPDVCLAYNGLFPEALAAMLVKARRKIPFLLEVDDLPSVRRRVFHPKALLDSAAWPWALRKSDGFIVVNSEILPAATTAGRPTYLLPGVLGENLRELVGMRRPPFSSQPRLALYAGGLSDYRRGDLLLEAIPQLPDGWKLLVAGSGPLVESFKELAWKCPGKCEYVGLLGQVALYELLSQVDVVINTPERLRVREGVFPFKILEYVASGSHVISAELPFVQGLNLRWCQRWDGTIPMLQRLLQRAEADYVADTEARQRSVDDIWARFGLNAVAGHFDRLLKTVVDHHAR